MVHNIFKGLGIALITPFLEDGSVDYKSLIRLVQYQLDNGADFFCILATTGETPTLTQDEKQKIKNLIVDLVGGRVPILMGCGGNNTAAVINELQTGDFRGIDGILSVCPYYNKPSQEGLYQHFKAIEQAEQLRCHQWRRRSDIPDGQLWRCGCHQRYRQRPAQGVLEDDTAADAWRVRCCP